MTKLSNPQLEEIIETMVRKHGVVGNYEANVYSVEEDEMRDLHHKWMKQQGYEEELHDVLSFPLEREVGPDGVTRLGDIVICKSYADSLGESLEFLVEHGCLHLLGIHHN